MKLELWEKQGLRDDGLEFILNDSPGNVFFFLTNTVSEII